MWKKVLIASILVVASGCAQLTGEGPSEEPSAAEDAINQQVIQDTEVEIVSVYGESSQMNVVASNQGSTVIKEGELEFTLDRNGQETVLECENPELDAGDTFTCQTTQQFPDQQSSFEISVEFKDTVLTTAECTVESEVAATCQ
ncbi:hypothetical protein [Candidatus Nanohalovita haloferacivicina]|uniref:hypothetical protein n=1 Tax=Candidatus Nanohalovita haloferacivicina TaxID=2978046 RepID=UPI00325FB84F|nr:hypothetical protein HBNXNv_0452 [Candidatus Nanohalobia archaeon BNXNv]